MEAYIRYIILSSLCLGICYAVYLLLMRKKQKISHLRYFLLISMLLAIVIPFSKVKINLNWITTEQTKSHKIVQALPQPGNKIDKINYIPEDQENTTFGINYSTVKKLLYVIYFAGLSIIILRLLLHLFSAFKLFTCSEKKYERDVTLLINEKIKSPYNFFHWIFLPENFSADKGYNEIIAHERVHASQYHSVDLILIELLSAVMWFNPLVWMMKKSIQLVHEYLADEGALNTGIDKLKYQAILINEVAEGRIICLSSSFNRSTIKKRMIMMSKSKINKNSRFKILGLIPVTLILLVGVACLNGRQASTDANKFTVVIDAGHGGKDSGAKVGDKINEKDLTLSLVNLLREKASADKDYKLIFTREDDKFMSLAQRVEKAKESKADLFISLHFDKAPDANISGIKCYTSESSNDQRKSSNAGRLFLTEFKQLNGIKTQDNIQKANFYVLRNSECPALLLNIGFLSNANDLVFVTDPTNQELICDKILNAIHKL